MVVGVIVDVGDGNDVTVGVEVDVGVKDDVGVGVDAVVLLMYGRKMRAIKDPGGNDRPFLAITWYVLPLPTVVTPPMSSREVTIAIAVQLLDLISSLLGQQ